jgi:hypothetical protein
MSFAATTCSKESVCAIPRRCGIKGGPAMIKYLIVSGLLLMSLQAKADDGYTLLKECTAFVKGDSVSEEKGGLKLWAGCPSSFESALSTDVDNSIRRVCLPSNVKNGQLAKIMVKYLEDHPEHLNRDEFELVREVLHKHFPCSIVDQLKHWKLISE